MDLSPENNGIHSLVPSKSNLGPETISTHQRLCDSTGEGEAGSMKKKEARPLKKKKRQVSTLKWNNFCSFHSGEKRTSQVETLPGVLVCGVTLSLHHPYPKN